MFKSLLKKGLKAKLRSFWHQYKGKILVIVLILIVLSAITKPKLMTAGFPRSLEEGAPPPESRFYAQSYERSLAETESYVPEESTSEDRHIIWTASLEIEVENPEEVVEEIKTYIASLEGFVEKSNISEYTPETKQAYLTLRVPSEKFEEAISTLKNYGYVKEEQTEAEDVTETYTDKEARLANLKAQEETVRALYEEATTIEETLSIYRELENLRFEIEMLEKDLMELESQTTYATLRVHLIPEVTIEEFVSKEWNFVKSWKENVNNLFKSLQGLADLGIKFVVFGAIWGPILVIVLVIYFIRKKHRKK